MKTKKRLKKKTINVERTRENECLQNHIFQININDWNNRNITSNILYNITVFYFIIKVPGPLQGEWVEGNDDCLLFFCERLLSISIGRTNKNINLLFCSLSGKINKNPIRGDGCFWMVREDEEEVVKGFVCLFSPHHCGFGFVVVVFAVFLKTQNHNDEGRTNKQNP